MKISSIRPMIKLFKTGNVCVTGLRGCGKDMLTANVVVRRKKPYISNVDYGGVVYPLDFSKIDCGKNTYVDFVEGTTKPYRFPYPMGSDVYISDGGVYLPSQYCNEINKRYPFISTFMALSRHVGDNNVHFNCQNLNRMYDKIREQSDTYITCNKCFVVGKLVFQLVTVYDRYQSCVDRVKPPKVHVPLFNAVARMTAKTYLDNFENTHGKITRYLLIYKNKSNYDTVVFRKMLGGDCDE